VISSELELAIAHLLRAKELAEFCGFPEELIQRIDLLKRAVAKVRNQAQGNDGAIQAPQSESEVTCQP
jgi:hypothetical protein